MSETTAVAVRHEPEMGLQSLGNILSGSGFFKDTRSASQAIVKVLAGRELGIGPIQSMVGIHVIESKIAVGAGLLAALVKRSGKYNFLVTSHTDTECVIEFTEGGKKIGTSKFDMADAVKAGVNKNPVWTKYPRNMTYARAMSNGVRWYCPDITSGPIYVPEELGHGEFNAEGEAINVQVVEPVHVSPTTPDPAKPAPATAQSVTAAPMQSDEQQGIVDEVDIRDGGTQEKPWTKYGVKIGGKFYGTFDHTLGTSAQDWIGQEVYFTSKPSKNPKYTDLVSIRRVDESNVSYEAADGFMFGTEPAA